MRVQGMLRTVGLISALSWAVPGAAETLRNGDVLGDWIFSCVAIAESETSCALMQTILTEEGAPPLAQISFARGQSADQVVVSVVVPIGVEVSSNVVFATGDEGLALPFIFCTPENCLSQTLVQTSSLLPFLTGSELDVIYKHYGTQAVVRIPASSKGLREAFLRLGLLLNE